MEELFKEIEKWSVKYDFNFQFWHNNNSVYIEKDGIEMYNTGGQLTVEDILKLTLEWVYRVNKTLKHKRILNQ